MICKFLSDPIQRRSRRFFVASNELPLCLTYASNRLVGLVPQPPHARHTRPDCCSASSSLQQNKTKQSEKEQLRHRRQAEFDCLSVFSETQRLFVLWAMKVSIVGYIIIFGILPLIFHYSYTIQKKILFLNFVHWPPSVDFAKPESVGLEGARNFYLTTDEGVKIGTWQILPQSLLNGSETWSDERYEAALSEAKRPIFLYMHGNSGNRASRHRVELYKLFQRLDYHLVCFDYRSYGDSDPAELSEAGVVADSKYVLQWLMKKVNGTAPVFVWGHSLGTGVSSHALAQLAAEGSQPAGLFLESPFNNIADELREHPFAQIFRHLPWFDWIIVEPFYGNNLRFESDRHVAKIQCPIMILHAEDDNVVPFALGEKLYEAALKFRGNETNKVYMTRISSSLQLGHKWICRYEELPGIIEKFVAQAQEIQSL